MSTNQGALISPATNGGRALRKGWSDWSRRKFQIQSNGSAVVANAAARLQRIWN